LPFDAMTLSKYLNSVVYFSSLFSMKTRAFTSCFATIITSVFFVSIFMLCSLATIIIFKNRKI
jgi:hypothetical protein